MLFLHQHFPDAENKIEKAESCWWQAGLPTRAWAIEVLMGSMLSAVKVADVGAEKHQRPEDPLLSLPSSDYWSSPLEVPVLLQTKNAYCQGPLIFCINSNNKIHLLAQTTVFSLTRESKHEQQNSI